MLFGQAIAAHLGTGGSAILATHIDLGLPATRTLDVTAFAARDRPSPPTDDPFAQALE